jgi:hypothetical protein
MNKKQNFDNHLFVALSIIIGVAVTSALESWTLIIRNLDFIELSFLQAFWALWAFFYAIQFWWGLWKYQEIKWDFNNFLLFLLIAISIFLLNDLIYPQIVLGEKISLGQYYYEIRPWYFGTFFILMLLTVLRSLYVAKRKIFDKVNIGYYFSMVLTAIGGLNEDPDFHRVGVVLGVFLFVFLVNKSSLRVSL